MTEPVASEMNPVGIKEERLEAGERKFRLPRRLILKGVAAGVLVRAADKIIRYSDSERRSDLPIHWRFGNDALAEEDAKYFRGHPSVILGETATWQLDSVLPGASVIEPDKQDKSGLLHWPPDWLVAAGARSAEVYRRHHNVLVEAREHGSSMVVTDGDFSTSVPFEATEQMLGPMNIAKTAMFLGAVGVTAGSLYKLMREVGRMDEARKTGVPYTPGLTARVSKELVMAFGLMHMGDQAVRAITPEQFRPGVSVTQEMIIDTYHALSGVLSEKGVSLVDGINKSANASMALNARIVQELFRLNPRLKDKLSPGVYLYAGATHEEVKDLYFSRLEYISARVEGVADRLIDFYFQELNAVEESMTDVRNQTLDAWTVMTSRFGYPIPSFANMEEFRSMPKLDMPDSPRAILYKQLFKRIRQEDDKGKMTETYWALFQRLAQEDMQFNQFYERHVAPLRERATAHRDEAELAIPFGGTDLVFFEGIPHWLATS